MSYTSFNTSFNTSFTFTEDECVEFHESLLLIMEEYINENPQIIMDAEFQQYFFEDVKQIFILQFEEELKKDDDHDMEDDIDEMIYDTMDTFYSYFMPRRSYGDTCILNENIDYETIKTKIAYLKSIPQPQQRTPEWYLFRNNLITASNAYKAFGSDANRNQLIYEKCNSQLQLLDDEVKRMPPEDQLEVKEILIDEVKEVERNKCVNVDSPLHWGQKYEPLSVMIYEKSYKTKVDDFGCIQHSKFSFLGASPDGINVDENSKRFGRMLEIKNIVNREIDGVPKKEYWVQMQLQMEVCDLDECDFLETRFVEYEDCNEFIRDGDFTKSLQDEQKGIIMYFSKNGAPVYKFMPFDIVTFEQFTNWQDSMMVDYADITWIKNIYWRLDEISCVLVLRNKKWFRDNICKLDEIWKIIEKERKDGYEHRAPRKRSSVNPEINNVKPDTGCLLRINKDTGKVTANANTNSNIENVFFKVNKITTESFVQSE